MSWKIHIGRSWLVKINKFKIIKILNWYMKLISIMLLIISKICNDFSINISAATISQGYMEWQKSYKSANSVTCHSSRRAIGPVRLTNFFSKAFSQQFLFSLARALLSSVHLFIILSWTTWKLSATTPQKMRSSCTQFLVFDRHMYQTKI